MIVAGQKPLSEILKTIEDFNTIAVVACGTCVTVCMSGGEKDAAELTEAIRLERGKTGKTTELKLFAPKRQCDDEFLDEILEELKNTEAVLSLGCGAGVQFIAEKLTTIPVLPALNTTFLGVTRDVGLWAEMCQGCGECVLEKNRRHMPCGTVLQEQP
jgi:ferredoxin